MTERKSVQPDPVHSLAPVCTNQLTMRSIAIAYDSGANNHGFCRNHQPGTALHG